MGRPKLDARGRKIKDPNKPKRATSAYFFYLAFCREEAKRSGRSISKIAEFTKECSGRWKDLNDKDRSVFESQAAQDKARYDREMAQYTGGRSARVKDPLEPKRPLSGYFMFLADFRLKHKNDDIPNKELLKMAGEAWREMDDTAKMPYEKKSQDAHKQYEVDMANYRQKGKAGGAAANGGASAEDMDDDDDDDDDDE